MRPINSLSIIERIGANPMDIRRVDINAITAIPKSIFFDCSYRTIFRENNISIFSLSG